MGLRRIVVLLIALVAAGGTAMYARSWVASQQAVQTVVVPAAKEEVHEVLVADSDLPAGSFVKPQHLRWQRWPTDDVPETYVLKGVRSQDEMIGAVVRNRIAAGEPIVDGAVVKPGERGFLAAVLSPGMRAVSVPINATSSNSGLIFPGDRVDLILTQSLVDSQSDGGMRRVSETVMRDVRIIAMGTETNDDPREGQSNERAKTATLEVTPRQAEEVTLLTELGKLSLSLRSLADAPPELAALTQGPQLTWDRDVSRVLRSGRVSSRLLVLRGADSQNVSVQEGTQ
ncbi:MAG TPA: Flp pilus assembly protein CpaB [Geminicoccaceae bacterium]|nr:Flp pilus assembly protein CpaB [Geminicoccaceae bacterium]